MFDEIKKEILAELRRDTNGAVVGTMFEMLGSEKYINYGVLLPHIKKVAAQYHPNHALAIEMFNSKIREMKLCAIYIDNGDEVTAEQMELWSFSFNSQEIAENCASMLFYKSINAVLIAYEWLVEGGDEMKSYAAMLMSGKRARTNYTPKSRDLYERIMNVSLKIQLNTRNFSGLCYLLVSLAKADDYFAKKIDSLKLSEQIREEIDWQIKNQ